MTTDATRSRPQRPPRGRGLVGAVGDRRAARDLRARAAHAAGQRHRPGPRAARANIIISAILTPIAIGLLVYFAYALTVFRQRGDVIEDGPPIHGNSRLQGIWLISTVTIVLFLAAYGTYALYATESSAAGAGGGQGATLISAAPAGALQVQVVSQQWQFTFRYPQYGGVETTQLALPLAAPWCSTSPRWT